MTILDFSHSRMPRLLITAMFCVSLSATAR
jgi:hypothetical protein